MKSEFERSFAGREIDMTTWIIWAFLVCLVCLNLLMLLSLIWAEKIERTNPDVHTSEYLKNRDHYTK